MVSEGGAGEGGADVDLSTGGSDVDAVADEESRLRAGVGVDAVEGLKYRCTIAPSEISYSLSNFESVKALPLSSNRCESAGGAEVDACDMRDLSLETESVRLTVMGNDKEGLRDLTVRLIVASAIVSRSPACMKCVDDPVEESHMRISHFGEVRANG